MSEPIIECRDLHHSYGRNEVLRGLNFTVEGGRILGLLGKNGVGKTTTINILMGFLQPTRGDCRIFGEPSHDIRPETRRRIGLLHEGHLQYEFMNIRQVERFYRSFYPKWKSEIFYGLIDRMGLDHGHKIFRMSCGQRSQVALGLILAQDPDLLILDDYSMGLDAGYRRLFLDYLQDHVREMGITALITSHIVQDLERLVDDIIILDRRGVIVQSSLKDFVENLHCYTFTFEGNELDAPKVLARDDTVLNYDVTGHHAAIYSYAEPAKVQAWLAERNIPARDFAEAEMTLEDAFIGVTGKY